MTIYVVYEKATGKAIKEFEDSTGAVIFIIDHGLDIFEMRVETKVVN